MADLDPAVDWTAKLIARNRELLAEAVETREAAHAAIEHAAEVLQITMKNKVARELMRQKLACTSQDLI